MVITQKSKLIVINREKSHRTCSVIVYTMKYRNNRYRAKNSKKGREIDSTSTLVYICCKLNTSITKVLSLIILTGQFEKIDKIDLHNFKAYICINFI